MRKRERERERESLSLGGALSCAFDPRGDSERGGVVIMTRNIEPLLCDMRGVYLTCYKKITRGVLNESRPT